MANFGQILSGFGQAYQPHVANETNNNIKQQQLKAAIMQMAQEKSNQDAKAKALQSFGGMAGAGPGGTIQPQQYAQASGGNPAAFEMLRTAGNPYNVGAFNLQGREISGQAGIDRANIGADARRDVAETNTNAAADRNQANIDARASNVAAQQQGANDRNKYSVDNRKSAANNPLNLATLPEYKTAKSEFEEAKKDERNIIAHYPNVAKAYSDPQWMDARKRAIAAQAKMEAIETKTKATNAAADVAPTAAPQIPPEAVKQLQEGKITQFGNGQKWTLEGGQPKQVQ